MLFHLESGIGSNFRWGRSGRGARGIGESGWGDIRERGAAEQSDDDSND